MNNYQLQKLLIDRSYCTKLTLNLIQEYKKPVVTFSLNIPGLYKSNEEYTFFFHKYYELFLKFLVNHFNIVYKSSQKNNAGNYAWIIINETDALKIKKITCKFELIFQDISSLLDIDVYDISNIKIYRKNLKLPARKCYLCDNNSKLCARIQKHSIIKLEQYIRNIIYNDFLK